MRDDHGADTVRHAVLVKPAVPGENFGKQRGQTLFDTFIRGGRPQCLDDAGRHGGLRNARCRECRARLPHAGAREVVRVVAPEDDVRHETVFPLSRKQGFNFFAGARFVERREPQGHENRVPVPLIGIKTAGRYREPALVVAAQYLYRFIVRCTVQACSSLYPGQPE